MRTLLKCFIQTLLVVYGVGAAVIALTSGVAVICCWHHWWMGLIQAFVGIFLGAIGLALAEKYDLL